MLFPNSTPVAKTPTTADGPFGVMLERRRSPRRALHPPGGVRLQGIGDENQRRCLGDLLNIGMGGLQCRVATQQARHLLVDQFVDAMFRVGACPSEFDLRARIANITPAGSAEHQVLGLEFVNDSRLRASQRALNAAIAQALETKG